MYLQSLYIYIYVYSLLQNVLRHSPAHGLTHTAHTENVLYTHPKQTCTIRARLQGKSIVGRLSFWRRPMADASRELDSLMDS